MSNSFGDVLSEQMGDATLTEIAHAMAGAEGSPRNILSGLSRFQNGKRTPSKKKVGEIAGALGAIRKMSRVKTNHLRDELMRAAGHGDPRYADLRTAAKLDLSETEERSRLRPDCYRALKTVESLKEHEVQTILDHVGVSTMKLVIAAAKRGEEIEVVQLQRISAELQKTAARYSGAVVDTTKELQGADTVISAGRAKILVEGDVSPQQMQVLRSAAEMIKSVLDL